MDGNQKQPVAGQAQPAATPAPTPAPSAYNPPSLQEPGSTMPTLPNVAAQAAPSSPTPVVAPVTETPDPAPRTLPDAAAVEAVAPDRTAEPEVQVPAQDEGGFYHAGVQEEASSDAAVPVVSSDADPVEWTSGSESFQAHAGNWRMKMSLMAIIGGGLVFLITRSYFSAGAIVVAGILFGVLGSRAPRPINYRLDGQGMTVGRKHFSYAEFRAFSVSETTPTINLVPLKRFAPIMVLRYDPTVATDIVKALSSHLPMEAQRQDAVDSLVNRLRI